MDDANKNDSQKKEQEGTPEGPQPASDAVKPAEQQVKESASAASDEKPAPKKPRTKRPPRKKGPTYEDLEDDAMLATLQERFGVETVTGQRFLGQHIYTVDIDALYDVILHLRDEAECQFDYLVDLTAMDYLGDEKRFCLVYHLYSHQHGSLIRVKSRLEEETFAPSVTSIWAAADWMEREAYDMYGIEFSGHPDLKRILLPDDWHGYPLRKDYDIKLQDQSWVRKHLKIRKVPH